MEQINWIIETTEAQGEELVITVDREDENAIFKYIGTTSEAIDDYYYIFVIVDSTRGNRNEKKIGKSIHGSISMNPTGTVNAEIKVLDLASNSHGGPVKTKGTISRPNTILPQKHKLD